MHTTQKKSQRSSRMERWTLCLSRMLEAILADAIRRLQELKERMLSDDIDAGGREPFRTRGGERSEVLPSSGVEKGSSSSAPAIIHDLTVVDEDVLDCGFCFLPLKPPIFQCTVGHALCSSTCSEKLKHTCKCPVCGVAMPGGYQRCHAMERVADAIVGPCSNAPYGCNTRPVRHALQEHLQQCPHAPWHCPLQLQDSCNFLGSMTMLHGHLAAAHSCPCTAEACAGKPFAVDLRDGFNCLTAVRGSDRYLLVLNMANTPFGHAVSAVWVGSPAATASCSSSAPETRNTTTCNLELSFSQLQYSHVPGEHYLRSRFQVECTEPSKGLPDPNASFQFFVPKHVYGTGAHGGVVHVTAVISISSA